MEDYRNLLTRDPDVERKYAASGLSLSMLANRISWFFNLKGPSANMDSACSASLTALHHACQDLRSRDSSMVGFSDIGFGGKSRWHKRSRFTQALVGGSNILVDIDFFAIMNNMGFLSRDSRSFSFDRRGNGYGRGEGFGAVVLKRVSDAIRDGDTIRAVIRATGLNTDGRTPGITQPNGEAQKALVRSTYAKAQLGFTPTRYYEAHGTVSLISRNLLWKKCVNSYVCQNTDATVGRVHRSGTLLRPPG